jgi:hypothetical protein
MDSGTLSFCLSYTRDATIHKIVVKVPTLEEEGKKPSNHHPTNYLGFAILNFGATPCLICVNSIPKAIVCNITIFDGHLTIILALCKNCTKQFCKAKKWYSFLGALKMGATTDMALSPPLSTCSNVGIGHN